MGGLFRSYPIFPTFFRHFGNFLRKSSDTIRLTKRSGVGFDWKVLFDTLQRKKLMPIQDRDPVDRVVDAVRERVDRVREDVGHALNGDFDQIKEDTKRELAEAVRDSMEGRSRVDIPVNDRVTVQGRRERDGSVSVGIRVDFP